jgi:uncharacterized membrane protein
MTISGLAEYTSDALALIGCAALIAGYQLHLHKLARRNPSAVLRSVATTARTAWVESMMADSSSAPSVNNGILAVQTLRNSTMAASFMASTSILLMVGVLTLTSQGPALKESWHYLNLSGALSQELWMFKVLSLLLLLFFAFFSFTNNIRILNHVGYMINIHNDPGKSSFSPRQIAGELNRGGHFYSIGMRAFYYLVPLVFWLFGPLYMVGATLILVGFMLPRIDKTPKQFSAKSVPLQ